MKSASIKENCEKLKQLLDTLNDKWCIPFQQKLEHSKSAVIHFVRGKKTRPEEEVKTALGTIKATSNFDYLESRSTTNSVSMVIFKMWQATLD
jgi:hypothetical protein